MSKTDTDTALVTADELTSLKARADLLGLAYHPSIGLDKLREKVNAAATGEVLESEAKEPVVVSKPKADGVPAVKEETDGQKRFRLRNEANELVRIRVSCMNPAKKEWEGEIFTSGNATVGSISKYVPFNSDDGWHVPRILLNMIKERQCQIFVSKKDSRGNMTRTGKLIKEFAVEIMDPLTTEELAELAARQAATKAID